MEILLSRLEALPAFKDLLKLWCRRNDIKVSFLVSMTLSKSKGIYAKLIKTYNKSLASFKLRWLENELKLFHFCILALSTLSEIKIKDFGQRQWETLQKAFENKSKGILEYQAQNFITNKNMLKKKWDSQQDQMLIKIIKESQETIKWNEIAVQLFLISDKKYFRSSKQCRERWLNHLDDSIKHEKWTEEEDKMLVSGVLEEGKKWSIIMRSFGNQRTEHMIKNRFISLVLKYKKIYPLIQDEEQIVKKIAEDMEIEQDIERAQEREEIEKKLRPKAKKIEPQFSIQAEKSQLKEEIIQEYSEKQDMVPFSVNENSPFQPHHIHEDQNCQGYENMMQNVPTPNFISPLAYYNCNSFANNFTYFQYYLNCMNQEFHSR